MKIQRPAAALIGISVLLLLGVLLRERPAEGKAVPAVVRAKAIELVDKRGTWRAQLKVEADGQVVFRLRDARGTIRVKLGADENGSGLLLLDEATEPGVHLLATRSGTSLSLQRGEKRNVLRP